MPIASSGWLLWLSEIVVLLSIPLFGIGLFSLIRVAKGTSSGQARNDTLKVTVTWGLLLMVLLSKLSIVAAYSQ